MRERLTSARKQREATIKALQAERERLEALAAEWDDPRGRQVSYLLADPAPNADSLGAAIGQPDSPVMVVAGLVDLDLPTSAEVEAMAVRLDAASAQCELAERSMAQVRGGAGDALLALALSRMESTGDLSCPVCHQTQLGVSWMREAREQIAALADAQAEHAAATEELERARSDAWWMLQRGPSPEAPVDLEARELLYAWRAPGPSSTAPDLAVHLRVQHPRLRTLLEVESAAPRQRSSHKPRCQPS